MGGAAGGITRAVIRGLRSKCVEGIALLATACMLTDAGGRIEYGNIDFLG